MGLIGKMHQWASCIYLLNDKNVAFKARLGVWGPGDRNLSMGCKGTAVVMGLGKSPRSWSSLIVCMALSLCACLMWASHTDLNVPKDVCLLLSYIPGLDICKNKLFLRNIWSIIKLMCGSAQPDGRRWVGQNSGPIFHVCEPKYTKLSLPMQECP